MKQQFVHLHVHSEYSLLDGCCRISEMIPRAQELGMRHIALTDHGNMHGAISFYEQARTQGVNPIIGCEVYVAPHSRADRQSKRGDIRFNHLILLAENNSGYHNLCRLVSRGYLEGFYEKPRIDKELLGQYHEGLIGMSACLAGEIPRLILQGKADKARAVALGYQELLGGGNFFLELMRSGIEGQETVNRALIEISRETGIPLVATCDVHYLRRDDSELQDILLCLNTGKKLDDPDRMKYDAEQYYLRTPEEMAELFHDIPEAIENTGKIADRCHVHLEMGKIQLPRYNGIPKDTKAIDYLRDQCVAALPERYPGDPGPARERLDTELAIIDKTGFAGYFLIVWDFVCYAHEHGIMVGPGRGSGVGSIVAYLLKITNIDPLKYNLLFERFLNPERISMPDLDIDFEDSRRDEVIEYVAEKYGRDRIVRIGTLGRLRAKNAIRDVARVLAIPLPRVNEIIKLIPDELNIKLADAIARVPELGAIAKQGGPEAALLDYARRLEGIPRNTSTHAAGVVFAQQPVEEIAPLLLDRKRGTPITQYEMGPIERLGLLKMDFLGIRNITTMRHCLRLIRENHAVELNLRAFPQDDKKTMELLSSGQTAGIFQVESGGMRDLLTKLRPRRFEDIVALLALYRPGPLNSGMVDEYLRQHHDDGKHVNYLHPKLKPILKETYGIMVYQEQVMEVAVVMAGYTRGEADILRRAMGKKKAAMMQAQREEFIGLMVKRRYKKQLASKLFDLMEKFAEYGFNKSHSAAYAMLTYQNAFLKAHYPLEWMAALLSANIHDTDKVVTYIKHCRELKIEVAAPDINSGRGRFTCADGTIRFGLAAVRNVGAKIVSLIVREREENGPYTDFFEFCRRCIGFQLNRKVVETLVKAGALDALGHGRSQMAAAVDMALQSAQRHQHEREVGQFSLFGDDEEMAAPSWPAAEPWPDNEQLAYEKEALGLYVSGHPLATYADDISHFATCYIRELNENHVNRMVRVGGLIEEVTYRTDKRGQPMAVFKLEGLEGFAEVVAFSDDYARCVELIREGEAVMLEAKMRQMRNDIPQLGLQRAYRLRDAARLFSKELVLHLNLTGLPETVLEEIREQLGGEVDGIPVVFDIVTERQKNAKIRLGREFNIVPAAAKLEKLSMCPGVTGTELIASAVVEKRRGH